MDHRHYPNDDLHEKSETIRQREQGDCFGDGYNYGRSKKVSVGDAGSEMVRNRHERGSKAFKGSTAPD